MGVDHQLGDPHLLVHPTHHDRFLHRLVGPADEVTVEVHIHVVEGLDEGERLVDEDIVHIEGVLGQLHAALAEHLRAVDHRVH